MIFATTLLVTLLNTLTAIYCLRRYATRATVMQFCFVVVWTLHYVVGNLLVLFTRGETYTFSRFEYFEQAYLMALVAGQYFLWVYLFLLDSVKRHDAPFVSLRADSLTALLFMLALTIGFSFMLVYAIGPDLYFSQELSQFRARLGDYTGRGIGLYYYLASFLLPATILMGGYALTFRRGRNILIFLLALAISLVMFVPLGGRGRVVNIIMVLVLTGLIMRGEFRLKRLLSPSVLALIVTVLGAAYLWGVMRAQMDTEIIADYDESTAHTLSIDTTRLPYQAFIFETYPARGTYYGRHYLESAMGPFYERTGLQPAGLIPDLSSRWYAETIGAPDLKSAISPSYIGETYLSFGIVGIIFAPFFFFAIVRSAMWLGNEDNALSLAVIIYFVQFSLFHGGLYALFDLSLTVLPLLLFARFYSAKQARVPDAAPVPEADWAAQATRSR